MANSIEALSKELLSSSTLSEISKKVGISSKDAENVLTSILPNLLNGASVQANTASTKESFLNALLTHGKSDISNLTSFFGKADFVDGGKIINHLLGKDTDTLAKSIAKKNGLKSEDVLKVLAMAAPLLMTLLAKNSEKDKKESISLDSITNLLGSTNISNLASTFLGGSSNKKDDGFGLDDVADILGNVLKK